jgi:lipopolysaccharide transport system permease protein
MADPASSTTASSAQAVPLTSPSEGWTAIRPSKGWVPVNLGELWRYRELLYFLTWRDVKVRYKQTALGAAWAVIQPFTTMIIFTLFFGRLAKIPSDGIPYPIWSYCGLLPWTYFAFALNQSSNSLVNNQHLIKKVYFPRLVIPLSSTLAGLLDLAIAFCLLVGMMFYFGILPGWQVVFLPLLVLLAMALAIGIGLWLSALNIEYRDVRYTIPFLTQILLFLSPVAYPASLIPESKLILGIEMPLRTLYGLNPMTGVIEGFRWALLNKGQPPQAMFWASVVMTVLLFTAGLFYFRRMERRFADVV